MIQRRLFAFLFFLLAALPAVAAPLAVSGQVVDAAGQPVAGASVELVPVISGYASGSLVLAGRREREAAATAVTDAEGYYRLEVPSPGMFRVRIEARGFSPVEFRQREPLVETLELPAAELVADVGQRLRITDPGGRPLAGARLFAQVENRRPRRTNWGPYRQEQWSDEAGKIRLARGEGQRLQIYVHHPEFLAGEREHVGGAAVTVTLERGRPQALAVRDHRGRPAADVLVRIDRFAQGKTDGQGRLVVPVPESTEIPVSFEAADGRMLRGRLRANREDEPAVRTFDLPPAVALDGRVVDAASREPVPGALVWESRRPTAFVRTAPGGGFHLTGVKVGKVGLEAAAAGYFPAEAAALTAAGEKRSAPTLVLTPAAVVTGTVVDEQGYPIARAEIAATYQPAPTDDFRLGYFSGGTCTSDPQGRFQTRRLLPQATYHFGVSKPGYAASREKLIAPQPDDDTALEVVLKRGRLGFGVVVDEDDRPVAGAEVTLERRQPKSGSELVFADFVEKGRPDHQATTDDEGRFEVADLGAGGFQLTAGAPGFAPITVPGVEVPGGAGRLDLGTIVLSPGVVVAGRVVDADAQPVAGAEIVAMAGEALGFGRPNVHRLTADATAGADGGFEIRDRRRGEKIDLAARHAGFVTAHVSGVEAPPAEPVVITLHPASRVAGRVLDPEGDPIADATVGLSRLRRTSGAAMSSILGQVQTDPEGRFRIEEVEPGTLDVTATADGWQTAELANVEVPRGRDLEDLEIRLRPGAVISGTVRDPEGEPVIGAEIRVTGQARSIWSYMNRVTSDGAGNYRLSGLEPGKQTIEASHRESGQASKTLEVTMGENRLDFVLGGGFELSGQVLDAQGAPVDDARVLLSSESLDWHRDLAAGSGDDGAFVFRGVPAGTYFLSASHDDYADARAPDRVVVDGEPVRGLVVRMQSGAVIAGRLIGLDFEVLAGCRITARSPEAIPRGGEVDFEGRYRIPHAGPGTWTVEAETRSGHRAQGTVTVAAGEAEAELDLEFTTGHTLSGRVRFRGQPLDGAVIELAGLNVSNRTIARTDHRGRFEIPGLAVGRYSLEILDRTSGAQHRQEIEISFDRELDIVIGTTVVTGRVFDAESGEPIAGVELRVASVTADPAGGNPSVARAVSGQRGEFRFGELTAGQWRVVARKPGYAQDEKIVEILPGDGDLELEWALTGAEGLVFTVARSGGALPARLWVAVLDDAGNPVVTGDYPVDVDGRVLVRTVPAGRWELLVSAAEGIATVHLPVTVPGAQPHLALETGSALEVAIPELSESSGIVWLEVRGGDGRPFRHVQPWSGTVMARFAISRGRGTIRGLPAGSWNLTATAADGRSWSASVAATAGQTEQVRLE